MPGKRRYIVLIVLAILYVLTWIGGWSTYASQFAARAHAKHERAIERNAEMAAFAAQEGFEHQPIEVHPKPYAEVSWCVPVLPFVLVADSSYVIGPLWGEGGPKILVYYVFGVLELPIGNWTA